MKLNVLYLDNHLLVVCKNQGMLAQKDKTGDIDLLTMGKEFVKNKFHKPGKAYLGLVHRLDRPVSGVMVLARTSKAASRLSDQFRNNTPGKHYIALVEGNCFGQGTCIDYLLKGSSGTHVVNKMHPGALFAELTWRSVASKKNISLLKVVLKTGRPHQIRIQLSHMGFPVLGDFRYGAKKQFDGRNMALHCCLLGIEHPVKKQFMQWTAKPPSTWDEWFKDEIDKLVKLPVNT